MKRLAAARNNPNHPYGVALGLFGRALNRYAGILKKGGKDY
jgi:hypothetical protein